MKAKTAKAKTTKILLSSLLAITLVVGMMTALTANAIAGYVEVEPEYNFTGEEFTYTLDKNYTTTEASGSIRNVSTSDPTKLSVLDIEWIESSEDWQTDLTLKATEAGTYFITFEYYDGGAWYESTEDYEVVVLPAVNVGETYTYSFHDDWGGSYVLNENIKDIAISDANVAKIETITPNGDDVDVTIEALSAGTVYFTFSEFGEWNSQWNAMNTKARGFVIKVVESTNSYLDLSNVASNSNIKTLDQLYEATVTTNKTDTTKVQVSWTLENISASVTSNKIWDTESLTWIDDTANASTVTAPAVTAVFDFVNLSSVKIDAQVSFEAAEYAQGKSFAPTVTYDEGTHTAGTDNGKIWLDTANGNSTYSKENLPTGKVSVTVTPGEDDFKSLTASTDGGKLYGTYTVTLSDYTTRTVAIQREYVEDVLYLVPVLTGFDDEEHTYAWYFYDGGPTEYIGHEGQFGTTLPNKVTVEENGKKLNCTDAPSINMCNGNYYVFVDGILSSGEYIGG